MNEALGVTRRLLNAPFWSRVDKVIGLSDLLLFVSNNPLEASKVGDSNVFFGLEMCLLTTPTESQNMINDRENEKESEKLSK